LPLSNLIAVKGFFVLEVCFGEGGGESGTSNIFVDLSFNFL